MPIFDHFVAGHPHTEFEIRSVAMDVKFDVPDPSAEGFDGQFIGAIGLGTSRHAARLQPCIGVMFYDTIRYHTVGRVLGEHLTTIPLTPGEEVTLTQRSETLRESEVQQETNREFETERGIEGVWSTDISDTLVNATTLNLGGNLGVGVGGQIKAFTAEGSAGANAAIQMERQHTQTVDYGRELTRSMNARMRQSHRTLVSTSGSDRFERGITRVLRNDNPDRSVNHVFYKVYNKRKIVHERRDAKLCYRSLQYDDAGRLMQQLDTAINAIDPDYPVNWSSCELPETADSLDIKPVEFELIFPQPSNALGFLTGPTSTLARELMSDRAYSFAVTPPANFGLVDIELEIIGYTEKQGSATGGEIVESTVTPPSRYLSDGGILTTDLGEPGPGTRTVTIRATRPWWIAEFRWAHSLKLRATPKFASIDDSRWAQYQDCVDAARLELRERLSADLVRRTLAQGIAGFYGTAIADVRAELNAAFTHWTGNSATGYLTHVHNHFDWNEAIVELVPIPATAEALQARLDLIARVHRLAPEVDIVSMLPEFHTATARMVWLPISHGSEHLVVERLAEPQGFFQTEQMLNLWFRGYRYYRHTLGQPQTPRSTQRVFDSPRQVQATPMNAEEWQNDWEKPGAGLVLGAWSDVTPTDGVHVETVLSDSGVQDQRAIDRFDAELSELRAAGAAAP